MWWFTPLKVPTAWTVGEAQLEAHRKLKRSTGFAVQTAKAFDTRQRA